MIDPLPWLVAVNMLHENLTRHRHDPSTSTVGVIHATVSSTQHLSSAASPGGIYFGAARARTAPRQTVLTELSVRDTGTKRTAHKVVLLPSCSCQIAAGVYCRGESKVENDKDCDALLMDIYCS